MIHRDAPVCKRPGCPFTRFMRTGPKGSARLSKHCSAECSVYMIRARKALRESDGEEAAELLRLAKLLDARTTQFARVSGIFTSRE